MQSLTPTSRADIESIACALQEIQTLEYFEDYILNTLPPLLGADFASWNEHNESLVMEKVSISLSHQEQIFPLIDTLNATLPSHPLTPLFFTETGGMRYVDTVEQTLDHISVTDFHALEFYKKVASKVNVEDQLLLHISVKNGRGFLITLQSSQAFTAEQKLKASIIRGHLVARFYFLNKKIEQRETERKDIFTSLQRILTQREMEVITLVCEGKSNEGIASSLKMAKRTADKHVSSILQKLEVSSRSQIIARYGLWINE